MAGFDNLNAITALAPDDELLVRNQTFSEVTHLYGFEGGALANDGSGDAGTLRGSAALSSAQFKFGSQSLSVVGTSDLQLTAGEMNFGTRDFTIEGWAYAPAGGYDATWFRSILGNFASGSTGSYSLFVTNDPGNVLQFSVDGAGPVLVGTTQCPEDAWFHFAVSRVGNTAYLFMNGNLEDSADVTGVSVGRADVAVLLGWNDTASDFDRWPGYLDEIRVTDGTGRYTTSFTAPTEAYSRVSDGGVVKTIKARKLGVGTWQGACVYLTANESITGSGTVYIPWDAEEEDVGGWWTSGAATRLTVPSGVTRVRVSACTDWDSAAGEVVMWIRKNGSDLTLLPSHECDTVGGETISLVSRPLSVTAGDYFEVGVFNGGTTRNVEVTQSHFAIEAIG